MATVTLIGVSKVYSQQLALNNINANIEKGEFVAVVGPSGCGKSTLLRIIAGLDLASSGKILINNQCVNKIPPAQRDMAMVFQNYALYPHMTAFDNMAYSLKMRRLKTAIIKQKVNEAAELLQISDYLQRKPQALSGGQRQRVAMGRAIVRSPAVFLFDEPLSNLDTKLRAEMRHEIKKLHQHLNTTCIYVTHDQTEAMTLASQILVLNKGCIEQIGTPRQLYQQPQSLFVAGFTGHYPINFLPATINWHKQKVITAIGMELPLPPLTINPNSNAVVVAIRPEHFYKVCEKQANAILCRVEFIDDMGADKLVQARALYGNIAFTVRLPADTEIINNKLHLCFMLKNANLFDQKTALRLGGWETYGP